MLTFVSGLVILYDMKYKKLESFSTIKSGYAFRGAIMDETDGKTIVIQPKDVISGLDGDFVRIKSASISERHILERGSVLVTNRGAFCACVFNERFKAITTSGVFVIMLQHDSGITPEYLALYINSDVGQRQIASKQESMTVPALTIKQIQELEIPIISIEKQNLLSKAFNLSQRCKDIVLEIQKQNKSLINQVIKGTING